MKNVPCTCLFCGSAFMVWPADKKRGGGRFCSKSCQVRDQHANGTNKAARQREAHHAWNDGRYVDASGYVRLNMPDHPLAYESGYVLEHHLVAYELLGRRLLPNEVVHHKDENRENNSPENLAVMTRSAHISLHHKGKVVTPETRSLIRSIRLAAAIGQTKS